MKVRPLHDKVLVKRIDKDQKTEGGIIIPDTAAEKPQEGVVVEIGKGRLLQDGQILPLDVKKGDKVMFGKYGGTEITLEGVEHIIISESEILAVIG
ncbi:MAG: co-chaperone GroES [Thermodesulfobacteriota bacterium]